MPHADYRRCLCCRRGGFGPWYRIAFDGGPETLACPDCSRHIDLRPDGTVAAFDRCPHAALRLLARDGR